jgi:aspartokinase-like uncharacterized kinase
MKPDAVIKVGGSLFDWPGLPARLGQYLDRRSGARLVLIAGGGPAADLIRAMDRTHGLGDERSHRLALRALDFTAHLLAALLPTSEAVDNPLDFGRVWDAGRTPILATRRLLDEDERTSRSALPHTWDVTSDTIAAYVAHRLGAEELVLLKSAPLPSAASAERAARLGLVDVHFPLVAGMVPTVRLANLRDPGAGTLTLALSLDGPRSAG